MLTVIKPFKPKRECKPCRWRASIVPDLILIDIQLPEISGLDVTKWLKEDDDLRDIPVIAVTAFAMKGDEEKILQGGCEAYIAKPISVAGFIETVQKFLHWNEQ